MLLTLSSLFYHFNDGCTNDLVKIFSHHLFCSTTPFLTLIHYHCYLLYHECTCQTYRASTEERSRQFKQEKRDQGNYVRVIQGVHAQALRMQMVLSRQNTMYYDVLNTLQLRKEAAAAIAKDITHLKTKLQNPPLATTSTTSSRTKVVVRASTATSKATAAAAAAEKAAAAAVALQKQRTEADTADDTAVLRVQLLTNDREVIFYKV